MTAQITNVDALEKIQKAMRKDASSEERLAAIIDLMDDAGYAFEVEEEEEQLPFQPAGKSMWELEVTVSSIRTYFLPGTDADAALAFFKNSNLDGSDLYDFFASDDDVLDGEEDDAKIVGRAPSWVRYANEQGERD